MYHPRYVWFACVCVWRLATGAILGSFATACPQSYTCPPRLKALRPAQNREGIDVVVHISV